MPIIESCEVELKKKIIRSHRPQLSQTPDHIIESVPSYNHVTQKLYQWQFIGLGRDIVIQEPTLGITIADDVLE